MSRPDVIVVGLGAIGSAITCQLAQRGVRVVGIDRYHPPHDKGSSHGHSRITRLAVGEGAAYVPLVQRSHQLWREFEADTGRSLFRRTGLLIVASPASTGTAYHGQLGFFDRTLALAREFGVDHELLDAAAAHQRFPAFTPHEADRVYLEHDGGVLFPEACIQAQLDIAQRHGASLRLGERLLSLRQAGGAVSVRTNLGELHAAHVVLCTGAWLPAQVGAPLEQRLRVLRQVLHWLATDTPAHYDPASCPAFMWLHGAGADDVFFGFPMIDALPGVKVATEQFSRITAPDDAQRQVGAADAQNLFDQHLRGRMTGLRPLSIHSTTCLYTMAADGRFVVDRHPDQDHVTVVSPCSGHGFKHSAGLGEAIAQQLTGQAQHASLAPFAIGAVASDQERGP